MQTKKQLSRDDLPVYASSGQNKKKEEIVLKTIMVKIRRAKDERNLDDWRKKEKKELFKRIAEIEMRMIATLKCFSRGQMHWTKSD